jgi:hypothetical protein
MHNAAAASPLTRIPTPASEPRQFVPVTSHHRLLLGAGPTLDPPLGGDGLGDAVESLGELQFHRAASGGPGIGIMAGVVLAHARRNVLTAMGAGVEAAFGAAQDVKRARHAVRLAQHKGQSQHPSC